MKRFFGILLAAILIVTLIPVQTFATEEGFKASGELVEVIKQWEGFAKYPVWDYGQYSVGYGTAAPAEHLERYRTEGISEEEATQLLEGYMNSMGTSVNNFIKKHNLNVNQGQFDAMLSLTYNCGARWMLEVSTLRTSILEGWKGSDFIFAFGQWSTAGGATLPGLVRRRLAEANMYLNGEYSTALPENYCYVQYNANGGKANVITQGYDASEGDIAIRSTASYDNFVFEGWYTDPTGGEKVEKLDATVKGYTLYAHWRAGEGNGMPSESEGEEITGTPVSYSREITALSLNAFQQPIKGALVVDSYDQYEIVEITAEYTDSTGVKWGKVSGGGWINLSFTETPAEGDEITKVTVTVTGKGVNVRRGPGTTYAVVATANVGDKLEITRTTTGGGYTWGKFDKGWIALKYTNYDSAVNDSLESEGTQQKSVMGTVNVNEFLRIREKPGVGNAVVGTLGPKDRVEIFEQKAAGGMVWGRIDRGWISMDYVILDKESTEPEQTTPPATPEETVPPTTQPEETVPPTTQPEETTPPETQPEQPKAVTGKVKLNSGYLNIRTGPSTGYKTCGKYANGAVVTILEQKVVGTSTWGRTDKGWISMDFVKLDAAEVPSQPQQPAEPQQPSEPQQPTEPQPPAEPEKPAQTTGQKGTVKLSSGCLRVRAGAGTGYKIVDNLYNGDVVTILETKLVGSTQWGRIENGWVCMDYIKLQSDVPAQTPATAVTGTVNVNEFLRIRSGAGTSYSLVGYYYPNNKVTITEFKNAGGLKWGRTDRGWICMSYVILDDENASSGNQTEAPTNAVSGTVTGTGLRIRRGAGTNYKIIGTLTIGDRVTILETKTVSGMKWGRIGEGWVSLDYVKLT